MLKNIKGNSPFSRVCFLRFRLILWFIATSLKGGFSTEFWFSIKVGFNLSMDRVASLPFIKVMNKRSSTLALFDKVLNKVISKVDVPHPDEGIHLNYHVVHFRYRKMCRWYRTDWTDYLIVFFWKYFLVAHLRSKYSPGILLFFPSTISAEDALRSPLYELRTSKNTAGNKSNNGICVMHIHDNFKEQCHSVWYGVARRYSNSSCIYSFSKCR